MHGVKRVMVFCLMTAILPTILIITPLYLRHSVFADVTHSVAESDVVIIQQGISPVFCEGISLKMNSSFNAFQLAGEPKLSSKRKHIRLKKSMTLPDDTLEYWGFYLLKGALVKLRVCSRYVGSRILVVRGDKNLKTCGLLDHNEKKYGAKLDIEHSLVKVTYQNPAEVLGTVDDATIDTNHAAEEVDDEQHEIDMFVKLKLEKGKQKQRIAELNESMLNENSNKNKTHHKRHLRKHLQELEELKRLLNEDSKRKKRNIQPLDAHIKHGGNAFNATVKDEDSSVSSFETGLLTCYDGQILLTQGFDPSESCNDVGYLEKTQHMVTTHEVASDGYYYYIFYSDNDYIRNDLHAIFDIYKPTYRYTNNSNIQECVNVTECRFNLTFNSDELVIVEVPTRDGIEHELDDITYLTSICHPRMTIYMFFPIVVLLLILGCAFL